MLTFGLNRPLFSFGLSYPGYWFIIVEEELEGPIVFIARGSTHYIASELYRLYSAHEITLYEAYPISIAVVEKLFTVTELRDYIAEESSREFLPKESLRFLSALELQRNYEANEKTNFTASETSRIFIPRSKETYRI